MKTSNYLALLSILIPTFAQSQNYQTVQSNKTPFFIASNSDYFLANRIDAIDVVGQDSIFYPFQTIREDQNLNHTDPCKYYPGASWMGSSIEIKSTGENIFYNRFNEPISIQTQAAVNDTFTVYVYPNGDWIKGTVSSISPVSIFGYPDSMKVIDLFSNTNLSLENPKFVLSRDHGFIELFAPYNFPEAYQGAASTHDFSDYPAEHNGSFSLVGEGANGFSKPTVGEINDFEIGDLHQFSYTEEVAGVSKEEQFREIEIFNKFVWGLDSVVYFFKENGSTKKTNFEEGTTEYLEFEGEMEARTIEHPQQWQNPLLPEEFDGNNTWTSLFINGCGDVEEKVYLEAIEVVNSCLEISDGEFSSTSSIKNVGNLAPNRTNSTTGLQTESKLIYYARPNGDYCGQAEALSINLESSKKLNIYPNPSSSFVNIDLKGKSDVNIYIYDNLGRQVYSQTSSASLEQIDLSELDSGVYQVIVESGSSVQTESLIMNN